MTVRELIQHLQTLDQDKGIWVVYDSYAALDPLPDDDLITSAEAEYLEDKDAAVREGDYKIIAG